MILKHRENIESAMFLRLCADMLPFKWHSKQGQCAYEPERLYT